MLCPACSADLPGGAKFCLECGTKLKAACPECGFDLPAKAKFCLECGHRMDGPAKAPGAASQSAGVSGDLTRYIPAPLLKKLAAARASGEMQGERRVVTMLFCDLKGSTAAAENLDPEEWADIMNGAFERLIAPVYRYEGTLARLMGDAILAFFGAPFAHEDDAERAVLAGLDILAEIRPFLREIRARWGVDVDVRVGINTGLVVVGNVGSDHRIEYTAMGDAVNVAARMEQTAKPGTVQISRDTFQRVSKVFELAALGEIDVKGKSEPVPTWRVLGPKERPATERGIEGLSSPMVGRDAELAKLQDAFSGLREGSGRIVSIIAEAGLGKSRLAAEWKRKCGPDIDCGDVLWAEGRSLSYETGEPFAPVKRIFRTLLRIDASLSDEAQLQVLRGAIADVLPDDPDHQAALIGSILGLKLTGEALHRVRYLQPPALRTKAFEAALAVIESFAQRTPTVVIFEDLHWADTASLDLAKELMAVTDRAMMILVALFRPRHDEPSWTFHSHAEQAHPHRYDALRLDALPLEVGRELVRHLLAIDGIPDHVRDLIVERADGNPFFVEEVIRTLLDDRLIVREGETWRAAAQISELQVPTTLTGVLTARLDKLEEGHRRAAQVAAVIGREFDYQTLAAIAPDPTALHAALAELMRRGIVRDVGRIPIRRYRFKHGLTRDAAYDTLLLKHRRELHVAIAEHWEQHDVDRTAEIARHFLNGREATRALPYMVDAGDLATRAGALKEAQDWYRQALDFLDPGVQTDLARRCWEGLHTVAKSSFDPAAAITTADALIALGKTHENPASEISGLNKKAFVKGLFLGDLAEGADLLAVAEELAHAHDDRMGLVECEMYQCFFNTGAGDFSKVETYMRSVAATGRELGIEEPTLFGMAHLSSALLRMTRYDEALRQARETLTVAERMGNKYWVCEMLASVIPACLVRNGEVEEALALAKRGTDLAIQVGAVNEAASGFMNQGQIAQLRGDFEAALRCNRSFLEYSEATGMPMLTALSECTLGTVYTEMAGDHLSSQALAHHARAMELMKMPLGSVNLTWQLADIGLCSLAAGNVEAARELFETALTTPNASMHLMRPKALLGKAYAALMTDDVELAWETFRACDQYVRTRSMSHFLADVTGLGARIALTRGDPRAADAYARESETAARAIGQRPALFRALAQQAVVHARHGSAEKSATAAQAARAVMDDIAAGVTDETLRAGFLAHAADLLPAA